MKSNKVNENNTFAARLTEALRDSRFRRASDLALAVGISEQTISRWKRGHITGIKTDHLFAVAKALDVDPEWLKGGHGSKNRDRSIDDVLKQDIEATIAHLESMINSKPQGFDARSYINKLLAATPIGGETK